MFTTLRVLELASVLAGPSVGQFFAELGAEVIKVENPGTGGDVTRSWRIAGEQTDDRSAYFCSCNWGKKSIVLNLSQKADRENVVRLAARADIVIVSYKPGDAERLGVGYEQLKELKPSLIYGQITGYGSDDERVGYDAVIQAESGFMDLNGEPDGPPTKMPVALIDVLAAHQLKEGLLLALLKREKTGQGSRVEVSLMDTAIASLVNQATNWLVAGALPTRQGSAHPNIAPYGDTFKTGDGKLLLLAIGNDRQFESLLTVIGCDPREEMWSSFLTNQQRVKNRKALCGLLSKVIEQFQGGELVSKLNQLKIPAGLVHTVRDVLATPSVSHLLLHVNGVRGIRSMVAGGVSLRADLTAPPHLGEHTEEILRLIAS